MSEEKQPPEFATELMPHDQPGAGTAAQPGELVPTIEPGPGGAVAPATPANADGDTIEQPAKILRMGAMLRQLLGEIRADVLDEMSRARLKEIYDASLAEIGAAVSEDLRDELNRMTAALDGDQPPTQDELRIVKAQLVGWLEGLIQGIQATFIARQVSEQQAAQAAAGRAAMLPPGRSGQSPPRNGTYL